MRTSGEPRSRGSSPKANDKLVIRSADRPCPPTRRSSCHRSSSAYGQTVPRGTLLPSARRERASALRLLREPEAKDSGSPQRQHGPPLRRGRTQHSGCASRRPPRTQYRRTHGTASGAHLARQQTTSSSHSGTPSHEGSAVRFSTPVRPVPSWNGTREPSVSGVRCAQRDRASFVHREAWAAHPASRGVRWLRTERQQGLQNFVRRALYARRLSRGFERNPLPHFAGHKGCRRCDTDGCYTTRASVPLVFVGRVIAGQGLPRRQADGGDIDEVTT